MHQESDGTTAKLAERGAKLRELDLNVQLLSEEAGCAGDIQKRLNARKICSQSRGTRRRRIQLWRSRGSIKVR